MAAYAQFHHAPILVANVAVHNWNAFAKLGVSAAHWFDGFGFFVNIRQPMRIDGVPVPLDPAKPAMLTLYVGFPQAGVPIAAQTSSARTMLFGTTYADFELQIRRQLQRMFGGAGFNAKRDIAGIVINRWGHAYIAPQPGFYFGTAEHDRAPRGDPRTLWADRVWAQRALRKTELGTRRSGITTSIEASSRSHPLVDYPGVAH